MILYKALYKPDRRRKKLRLSGHVWVCDVVHCGQLVWEEPLGNIDETPEQQTDRLARIKEATESHVCPPEAA